MIEKENSVNRNLVRNGLAVLAAALLSVAAPPTEAQWTTAAEAPEPAAVSASGGAIELFPSVNYRRAILTVSRGDTVITRVFSASERPSIDRFDLEGNVLADGSYQWELQLIPDAQTARELRLAASQNGGEAPGAWQRQSGSFAVQGGTFASPDAAEPGEDASAESGLTFETPTPRRSGGPAGLDSDGAGLSEEEVRAVEASAFAAAQPYGAGLESPVASYGDGDGSGTTEAKPMINATEAPASAAVPHRSVEPGGTNGRPEKEE